MEDIPVVAVPGARAQHVLPPCAAPAGTRTGTSLPVARRAGAGGPAAAEDPGRFRVVGMRDPLVRPLLEGLALEYRSRYGYSADLVQQEMDVHPPEDFDAPHGCVLLLLQQGRPVAGGAYRRLDADTAEMKRIWTAPAHRRRGLAGRVVAELERRAGAAGYRYVHLTTGPRLHEAHRLYLAGGYVAGAGPVAGAVVGELLQFRKSLRA